jgi:hypothetical protein
MDTHTFQTEVLRLLEAIATNTTHQSLEKELIDSDPIVDLPKQKKLETLPDFQKKPDQIKTWLGFSKPHAEINRLFECIYNESHEENGNLELLLDACKQLTGAMIAHKEG